MPEGPFGGPRPFARSRSDAELNIYFGLEHVPISGSEVDEVRDVVDSNYLLSGPVEGPVGTKNNIVTMVLPGNQVTNNNLHEIEVAMENETGMIVDAIEVIW